jgi:hypothetical protein
MHRCRGGMRTKRDWGMHPVPGEEIRVLSAAQDGNWPAGPQKEDRGRGSTIPTLANAGERGELDGPPG